jgi:hypothetical protein
MRAAIQVALICPADTLILVKVSHIQKVDFKLATPHSLGYDKQKGGRNGRPSVFGANFILIMQTYFADGTFAPYFIPSK